MEAVGAVGVERLSLGDPLTGPAPLVDFFFLVMPFGNKML